MTMLHRDGGSHDISHYGIGDLAREFSVTLRSLRFYEQKGLLSPRRDGLSRRYSRRDHERLAMILRGKKLGFTLHEIREMLEERGPSNARMLAIGRDRLLAQIERLEQRREEIGRALVELRAAYEKEA
ncbi:MerR family transcriptional regulator [Labrys wisconsinensis]|uniref:DNA-binding transcriptional MerR regulator n=1 Tax=Labrys wisconsinensis TaxID=425677 RepID=A0ABU0JG55_9HYPH|nr:MerR family transcriptional regulator [Labrys wisconsinensis]MDQ0473276.1 DNA-binding transcriptional MerR regulator [Labrys wisconsinensis]